LIIATYLIPAWSSSILKIDKNLNGTARDFNVYQYGAKEMGVTIDTTYVKKIRL
jgi:hypothetical protein